MNVFYFGSSVLVEHINQQLQLAVENGFRIGQGIGSVLSEDLQADSTDDPCPHQKALCDHLIVAREAEFLANPFEI